MFSTNYSTLEDAWNMDLTGGAMAVKKPKKSKKSVAKDPICDLYEQGTAGYAGSPSVAYSEEDLIEYVNSTVAAAPYNKNETQKPMPEYRQEHPDVIVNGPQSEAHATGAEDAGDITDFMNYLDKTNTSQKLNNNTVMDIGVYILSGVILIFMMEQFVRIGTMMR